MSARNGQKKTCKGKHKAGTSGHSERLFDRKTGFRQCEDPKGISEICTVSGVDIKYNLEGSKYVFAMNGQTGKMVGDLPADKGAFWKYVVSRGLVIGVILYALMWLTVLI